MLARLKQCQKPLDILSFGIGHKVFAERMQAGKGTPIIAIAQLRSFESNRFFSRPLRNFPRQTARV